jgi:hypothetical protein
VTRHLRAAKEAEQVAAILAKAKHEAATWEECRARGKSYEPRLFFPGCPLFPLDTERRPSTR